MTNENELPLEQRWDTILAQLQHQMTRATFDTWVAGSRLVSARNGTWQVSVKNGFAKEWLENRLAQTVNQTVSHVVGRPVEIEYLVVDKIIMPDHEVSSAADDSMPPADEATTEAGLSAITVSFALEVDFEQLWRKSGFTQVPDYAIRFWRAYLGRAFDLWELLVSDDKRDVREMAKGNLPYWTLPRRYTYHGLVGGLRCSRKTLTGRLVPCPVFERLKKAARTDQQPPPAATCCERHAPTQWRGNSHNEPECVYWLEGLLERLYREGLLAVQRVQTPGKPRVHDLRLQVWRLLPLLTPAQVGQFPRELERSQHQAWLERYGLSFDISVGRWEEIPSPSLVPALPRYDEGRELHEIYQNNPFLIGTAQK